MRRPLHRSVRLGCLALPLLMGSAGCAAVGTPRTTTVTSVDAGRYLGTWYEIASVKQFFSFGLVGTTATYSLLPNGSIKVVNAGHYFFKSGPLSTITGTAIPLDASNARLNVSFTGANSPKPPGNYWIVALDPNYQWAVVSDPTGLSCFVLARTPTIDPALKTDLLTRAAAAGVDIADVTDTPQP